MTAEQNQDTNNNKIKVKKELPPNFYSSADTIVRDSSYTARNAGKVIHGGGGSTFAIRPNGEVNMSSGHASQFHCSPSGKRSSLSLSDFVKTNEYSIDADDIIVNNHKLNQKLYELADFKKVLNTYDGSVHIAGGLTMLGTVLVKAWEPNLQRYVLVRRQINMPVFSPSVGGPEINPGINITPVTSLISDILQQVSTLGIATYEQLSKTLSEARDARIAELEAQIAEENTKIKEANAKKQATSMTTLTGQDPGQFGGGSGGGAGSSSNFAISPKAISDQAKAKGDAEKQREDTDTRTGWDEANGRPVSTTAFWYHVKCASHKFYVMQGHTILQTWDCNYSYKGAKKDKVKNDDYTPLGVFTIASRENIPDYQPIASSKYPDKSGAFGPWYFDLDLGGSLGVCGIAIHGDFEEEDKKGILTKDSPRGQDPKPGEGSTHGCIRLSNKDVTTMAQQYATKTGQYVKIEA